MHQSSSPAILYFGTPVVIVSTNNEEAMPNLAPISSVFWLGWRCVIGIGMSSKTFQNLQSTRECVLNIPSASEVESVNRLALTTGSNPVPDGKQRKGYRFEANKFRVSGFTPTPSELVDVPSITECPVHLEAQVVNIHMLGNDDENLKNRLASVELKIVKVRLDERILMRDTPNRVDPDRWRPLIMSFQEFYGLGEKIHSSRLATIPESEYRTPDHDRARRAYHVAS